MHYLCYTNDTDDVSYKVLVSQFKYLGNQNIPYPTPQCRLI